MSLIITHSKAGLSGKDIRYRNSPGARKYTGRRMYTRAAGGQAGDFLGIGHALSSLANSTVGKVLSIIPGVGQVVGLAGTVGGLVEGIGGRRSVTSSAAGTVNALGTPQPVLKLGGGPVTLPGIPSMPGIADEPVDPNAGGPTDQLPSGVDAATMASSGGDVAYHGGPIPQGYHWNKSGYWVNGSKLIPGAHYVPKGTKLVRNRTRNPFNPRAASRSMSRLSSLHHGMKALERNLSKLAPKRHTRVVTVGRKR